MTMRISGVLAAAILIAAALPARAQQLYPTPEAAVKDLVDSAKAKIPGFGDRILGKEGAALLRSGDPAEDAENLKEFNEAAAALTAIDDGPNGAKLFRVGNNGWTLPLPLVKTDAGWKFDPVRGKEEMTNRRIGYDELSAIAACEPYVEAQDEYFTAGPGRQRTTRIRDQVHLDARQARRPLLAGGKPGRHLAARRPRRGRQPRRALERKAGAL